MKNETQHHHEGEAANAVPMTAGSQNAGGGSVDGKGSTSPDQSALPGAGADEATSANIDSNSAPSVKFFSDMLPNVDEVRKELQAVGGRSEKIKLEIADLEKRLSDSQTTFAELTGALAVNNARRQRLLAEKSDTATIDKTIASLQRELRTAGDMQEGLSDLLPKSGTS